MQPEVVGAADGRNEGDGVVGAEDGSAGGGVDVERCFPRLLGSGDGIFEGRGEHTAGGVDGDGDDGAAAETDLLRGLYEGVVAVGGGEEDKLAGSGGVAMFFGGGKEGIACDYDGGCVGG